MFWQIIAIISISFAIIYGGLEMFITISDRRDRRNYYRQYRETGKKQAKKPSFGKPEKK